MPDPLSAEEQALVAARTEQFRHALAAGSVTDWEQFLAGLSDRARIVLLTELVLLDLNHRWDRGERPVVEEYVRRFPALGPLDQIPPALILAEHRCRTKAGEPSNPTEFRSRFPAQYPALQTELEARSAWTIAEGASPRWEPIAEDVVAVSQQYELVRELGRGTFGEVWLARKKPSGIEKAIKILMQSADRESAQRELRSLELIKNLRHPYLLATEDFWVANNRVHIVMELADGTLRGRLKHYQALGQSGIPEDELFRYLAEAAEGLDFLHEQKIAHRDVKPDNILILHGHAKLADFGLARRQEQLVESMSFAGTPSYMAPEVWGGEGGPASDQYSLAMVYTELRQGCSPLPRRSLAELMKAHQDGLFAFADAITEAERTVLRRAMAKTPEARFASCAEFAEELAYTLGRPFSGKSSRASARREALGQTKPSLSANFGSVATEASESSPVKREAKETVASNATVVTEPEVQKPPKPKSLIPQSITVGLSLMAIVLVAVWVVMWINVKDSPPTNRGNETPLVFPAGTTPEPGSKEMQLIGKKAPEWVVVEKSGKQVRFRLITANTGPSIAPFYIMESKVTSWFYSTAGKEFGFLLPAQPAADATSEPVMNVTALEARDFAVKVFGGDLPSADEWDHAAGVFDQGGQSTPTLPPGRAWIGMPVPGSVNRAERFADINRFGLLDMAGNGREWTRTVLTRSGEKRELGSVPLADTDKVILRGRNYTLDRPLTFAILNHERTQQPQVALPNIPSPYTTFRVVLPLP
ncbi:MAG: bifunctional serine/threonine-protein kinase/formylglycine-generating enzyme family protein [Planctomycetia bacterium]|nr:bifunctional serine/threonine-protein kinase/formylglycine-generating enzyme family protein [Planctomycetia bacterium]